MTSAPEGIDAPRVEAWFQANVPGATLPLVFERVAGGRSNLTYRVDDAGGRAFALRRPPLGKRLGSAHDMSREHKAIAALADTPVPVPPIVGICADESVNGAPFYVMDFVEGPVVRSGADAEPFDEPTRRAIGERVVDTLAAIHDVDPDAVGLGDLGRKEDYVARQLHRWHGQWEKSQTRELPLVDDLHRRLAARIPEQGPATIVHGDYRLDNMILSETGEVAAVVDWELCTLGDPLADVGLLLVYWSEPDDELMPLVDTATTAPGFPEPGGATRALRAAHRPRPLRDRLLRRARLLEAGDHPRGRVRAVRGRRLRGCRFGLRALRGAGRAAWRRRRTRRSGGCPRLVGGAGLSGLGASFQNRHVGGGVVGRSECIRSLAICSAGWTERLINGSCAEVVMGPLEQTDFVRAEAYKSTCSGHPHEFPTGIGTAQLGHSVATTPPGTQPLTQPVLVLEVPRALRHEHRGVREQCVAGR